MAAQNLLKQLEDAPCVEKRTFMRSGRMIREWIVPQWNCTNLSRLAWLLDAPQSVYKMEHEPAEPFAPDREDAKAVPLKSCKNQLFHVDYDPLACGGLTKARAALGAKFDAYWDNPEPS